MDTIKIKGARTHNLKNISLSIPRDQLVVITGLSGSGKSSLAFDTLYAEGQRRYVESLSAYARQFLAVMDKPDVDTIEGLSPAISIEQKATSHNPRSTVGTITEIYDYLRLLFARIGEPRCPTHQQTLDAQSISEMTDRILSLDEGSKIMITAPVLQNKKGKHEALFEQFRAQGCLRVIINGHIYELDDRPKLNEKKHNTVSLVIDRLVVRGSNRSRLAESLEHATAMAEGLAHVHPYETPNNTIFNFSTNYACQYCGYNVGKLEPRLFSFNNPVGACFECKGLGTHHFFDENKVVPDPQLTLTQGAISGWDKRHFFYYSMLTSLAKHYGFSCDSAFCELPKKIQKILLYGSGEEAVAFRYTNHKGTFYEKTHSFEGVIPNMQRRFHETESGAIREELSKLMAMMPCAHCEGERLTETARHVYVDDHTLPQLTSWSIIKTLDYFKNLKLEGSSAKIADKVIKEIKARLQFLVNVGLNYLTLSRSAETLSGGEAQRIRLASQIGSGLVGVMYILDEPSIGLHQRDNERLLNTLKHLKDLGNSVIVVEHDEEAILYADQVIDIGPGAGVHGGRVIAQGTPQDIENHPRSLTGQYLSGKKSIKMSDAMKPFDAKRIIEIKDASQNNLKSVDATFPMGLFTCVTGVSGSGKSTLINHTLYPLLLNHVYGSEHLGTSETTLNCTDQISNIINITQSPIGRTPRSNPATYTGLLTHVRDLFTNTPEARTRGYKPGRFSFNVKGGRCESCQGEGLIRVEMHFLPDVYVNCDVCHAKRYNRETLEILYKGKNIHDVLSMTVEDALVFFSAIPSIKNKLTTLGEVGLGYIRLGQSAITLSGGEAQRIKLAKELSKRDTGNTLYILDEPTTGLHFHDIQQLLNVIQRLRDKGNTIIVIEHNLDVIKTADWVIDLGPEGGDGGGDIIATGTPLEISKNKLSFTGKFLKQHLAREAKKAASIC